MSDQTETTLPDAANFRKTLGRLPTGVVIVTGGDPQNPSGLVVGSFMSLSLDPPLVGVSPAKTSSSWPAIQEGGHFCANVLHKHQEQLARQFSKTGIDKFEGVEWEPAPATGAPRIKDAAAWIDCTIESVIETGDHLFVVGLVKQLGAHHEHGTLAFLGGAFHQLGL